MLAKNIIIEGRRTREFCDVGKVNIMLIHVARCSLGTLSFEVRTLQRE